MLNTNEPVGAEFKKSFVQPRSQDFALVNWEGRDLQGKRFPEVDSLWGKKAVGNQLSLIFC